MDDNSILIGLGTIVVLGIGMQWLSRRIRLPAILLLLGAGLVAGPGLDLVKPDEIFGDALFPVVSLAVGLLLFEGGLGLDIAELRAHGPKPVVRLVTVGVAITAVALALVSMPLFSLPAGEAALLGALLVVSGPTVVGPLLKLARPRPPSSTILRWEGIVIDPIGATLALIVLQVVLGGDEPLVRLVVTIAAGMGAGLAGAMVLIAALRRFAVPDELELAVTFMVVIASYTVAEAIASESGLFATTAFGVLLANQRYVQVRRITAFNENIGIILLGGLFIVLAARTQVDQLLHLLLPSLGLVAFAVVVVRPFVTWLCTAGTAMRMPDRIFIGAMAPRGIVAAATSALFSLKLADAGVTDEGSQDLASIVFLVIVGTCLVYGVTAAPLARRIGVALPDPNGVLLVGSPPWLLSLADRLSEHDVDVSVVATNRYELAGRSHPWKLFTAPMMSARVDPAFAGVHSAVIAALDDEHNAVALARALEDLSRSDVFVLPASQRPATLQQPRTRWGRIAGRIAGPLPQAATGPTSAVGLGGDGGPGMGPVEGDEELVEVAPAATWTRRPFAHGVTQRQLAQAFEEHGAVRAIEIDADATDARAVEAVPEGVILLCVLHSSGRLDLAPRRATVGPGDTVFVLGEG
ncbi:cation:proton antiporter [Rhabdothermincola salaria]|uniref:cation:proton antiporter n=1 Tax=Rhabdothermincola salaria TaxID=2903142 RepID=UPI001E4B292B|nr:cation:proton antiporter [Rhabdothermincola salaria]MCD9623555.1 cation:proton antiporter [Rhabdothermincola salaria]